MVAMEIGVILLRDGRTLMAGAILLRVGKTKGMAYGVIQPLAGKILMVGVILLRVGRILVDGAIAQVAANNLPLFDSPQSKRLRWVKHKGVIMNASKNAYLVLGYACNQKCKCCPLIYRSEREPFVPYEKIKKDLEDMIRFGVTDVTLSGGEPTLHPRFNDIINEFLNAKINVHILSNGEKFANKTFSDEFIKHCKNGDVCVTTTFHSQNPIEHEEQNLSIGSFKRSLDGLKYLDSKKVNIAIKHCITRNNYKDLPLFIQFVLQNFSDNIEIQLWGIDLCGIDDDLAKRNFVSFKEIKPYIEEAVNLFEMSHSRKSLTINNLPLCMCDCYYWKYYTRPEQDTYIEHKDNGRKMDANSGPISCNCDSCPFKKMCMGAYYSDFEIIGDDIVSPPILECTANHRNSTYISYAENNIDNNYLSPYVRQHLTYDGLFLVNVLTNYSIKLRLKCSQILVLQNALEKGISDSNLFSMLCQFGLNANEIINEMQLKGIIE